MVFVSVDYRLGPFGWFAEPALRDGGSPQDTSGNYGTLDLIKALGWIRDNISAFGGDPSLVTLTGQSAGAADVLSLLLSPLATGRFQRAICESGARSAAPLSTGEARSFRTLCALLVNDRKAASLAEAERAAAAMSPEAIRSYLRSRSDREILHCYPSDSAGIIDNPGPFLDGYVMPSEGFGRLETGDYPNKIPLIIGSNKEELKLFLMQDGVPWRSEEYAAVAQWGSELWKAGGVDAVARDLAAAPGQPAVYVYRFDWGAPDADGRSVEPGEWGTRLGAFHGLEIPFMLGQDRLEIFADPLVFSRANEPGRKALSSAMMSYAAQFARTGNPNTRGSGLPIWDAWANDSGAPKFIVFDARDDSPSLLMSDAELTREGVMASLENSVSEPLLGKVEEFLSMLRTELQIE